jgi:phosphatidylethanolamine/phosphatidyl-N-methylethanolamine N-methyltransferase
MNYQEIEERYKKYYGITQYGRSTGSVNKFWHQRLEKNLPKSFFENVLEVGSGSGEHLCFVSHGFNNYYVTDLYLPNLLETVKVKVELGKKFNQKQHVFVRQENVEKLSFNENSFQRVVSTCLFHHLENPLLALQELRRVTCDGGSVSVYLPSDPGIMYRIAQALVSTSSLRKYFSKKEISFLRAGEHRNHVQSLTRLIEGVFAEDSLKKYSFPLINLGWNFNFFYIYQITISKKVTTNE